ncbi:MAG: hypothetical protein O7E57_03585 [Gammaproteobacteria bacterium]|nr:hypothetical protein [Gammaproteobacteria bacterium]
MNHKTQTDPRKSLVAELESIRVLLGQETLDPEVPLLEVRSLEVPLLDEVVPEDSQSEGTQTNTQIISAITGHTDVSGDLLQTLLDEDWRTSTLQLLSNARESIKRLDAEWTPAFTDELNEALCVRINETVTAWLRTVIAHHADELRSTLNNALSEEIASSITRLSNSRNSEGADGE